MRDDKATICHGLKGNASQEKRSKRDGDDRKYMRDRSKNEKVVFISIFLKFIVTSSRSVGKSMSL